MDRHIWIPFKTAIICTEVKDIKMYMEIYLFVTMIHECDLRVNSVCTHELRYY